MGTSRFFGQHHGRFGLEQVHFLRRTRGGAAADDQHRTATDWIEPGPLNILPGGVSNAFKHRHTDISRIASPAVFKAAGLAIDLSQFASQPPSTVRVAPCTKSDAAEAR